jgi:A/G-specific adenine glycosylase
MDITKLEAWYIRSHRKLIFRETKNPYHIWVSEVMLQQTQVETVLPYFESFIKLFPNPQCLAEAEDEKLMKAVEGLGYYRRFRLMKKAARYIVDHFNGEFPNTYEDVLSLPGVGLYTAGAIMSIAYHEPRSALDGNVIRVLSRYLGVDHNMREEKHKRKLDQINQTYIEKATPAIYTQAMMELGATICRPKNPQCGMCPLQEHCVAYAENRQHELPVLSKLKEPIHKNWITLIIQDEAYIYLRKREEELLKGMYEYPQFEEESVHSVINNLQQQGIILDLVNQEKTVKHVFSHQVWHMDVYVVRRISGMSPEWIRIEHQALKKIPMATAHRKIKF